MRTCQNVAYRLKIVLVGTRPPIWRRLLVPASLSLRDLHRVIQVAMGWDSVHYDSHLHELRIAGTRYADPAHGLEGFGARAADEGAASLAKVAKEKDRFSYLYDFGDSWDHRVVVEKVSSSSAMSPVCLGGARACPPEDCGGLWGYDDLFEVLSDPTDPRHAELSERAGELADPDVFALDEVNRLLDQMYAPKVQVAAVGG
jgi:hypothetical protein